MAGFVLLWAGMAVVLAFTDLSISQALYNSHAGWAKFLAYYGEIPGSLVAFACGNILIRLFSVNKNPTSIAGFTGLSALVFLVGIFVLANASGIQYGARLNYPLLIIADLVLIFLCQAILRKIPQEQLAGFIPAARVGLTLFLAALLTVWVFKISWGRWDYRQILNARDLSLFTPWYLPQGYNGHFSFMSGHAAVFMCVLPAALFFDQRSKAFYTTVGLGLVWGITGSLSRVVVGAHFASDVLFGACVTILWFILLTRWFKAGQKPVA